MLSRPKGADLIKGVRGEKGVDETKLVDLILRVSRMAEDLPAIRELDLNPIMAFADHVVVVDARIIM
jgi:acyl-CoA synthetase (NDP forming)